MHLSSCVNVTPLTFLVYDRDAANQKSDEEISSIATAAPGADPNVNKEVQKRTQTYYQVLIDQRDVPFIRAQSEAVTFLGNNQENSRSLYAIPGLDYVSHDDVLPYTALESTALSHELFDKFLAKSDGEPPFRALDTLKAWQKKNHAFLELSDVHIETTNSIRITVIPFFMGKKETPSNSVYWWRYCIRLENLNPELSVQLRERHWRIFSLSGTLETVRGRGIVGQEPILNSRLPAFQYSSHVSLQAPSGHMWGTFLFHREDGLSFDCR
jgi:polymerase delta-interacting protein 2